MAGKPRARPVSVHMQPSLIFALDELADQLGTSRSALMIRAIERGLESDLSATCGPLEAKTISDLESLVTSHPMGEALAELAIVLARDIDRGGGSAAGARELRATINDLIMGVVGNEDDINDLLGDGEYEEDEQFLDDED